MERQRAWYQTPNFWRLTPRCQGCVQEEGLRGTRPRARCIGVSWQSRYWRGCRSISIAPPLLLVLAPGLPAAKGSTVAIQMCCGCKMEWRILSASGPWPDEEHMPRLWAGNMLVQSDFRPLCLERIVLSWNGFLSKLEVGECERRCLAWCGEEPHNLDSPRITEACPRLFPWNAWGRTSRCGRVAIAKLLLCRWCYHLMENTYIDTSSSPHTHWLRPYSSGISHLLKCQVFNFISSLMRICILNVSLITGLKPQDVSVSSGTLRKALKYFCVCVCVCVRVRARVCVCVFVWEMIGGAQLCSRGGEKSLFFHL